MISNLLNKTSGFIKIPIIFFLSIITNRKKKQWELLKFNNKPIKLNLSVNHKAKIFAAGDIARVLYTNQLGVKLGRGFESEEISYFEKNIKDGDIVIDAGANIGLYSIIASKLVGKSGEVHSFEPALETFNILEKNILINNLSNVKINKMGLGDKEGKFVLSIPNDVPYGFADSYRFVDLTTNEVTDSKKSEIINIQTIDNYCAVNKVSHVDFIKIDVEGLQYQVLIGAKKTLENNRVIILFEAPPTDLVKNIKNYKQEDSFIFLNSIGYSIYIIEGKKLSLLTSPYYSDIGNFLAIKRKDNN